MKLFSIKKENIKIFLLVIVIIVNMFGVMLPRFFNDQTEKTGEFFKYPIHVDEWQNYTISSFLKESFLQPTVFYYKDSEKFLDGSPFFHWMIYLFQIFGGGLNIFFVLPLIQISFLSIVLFLLLSKIFNIPIAFFSSIIV